MRQLEKGFNNDFFLLRLRFPAIPNLGECATSIKEEQFILQAFNSRKLRSDALLGSFEVIFHYLYLLLFNYLRVAIAAFSSNFIWSLGHEYDSSAAATDLKIENDTGAQ